ncbi:MAG: replication-relaxation family protein [Anaerolineae bacterium]|nr:replication-relaxation family protein [Anaerolineae bacterium]
MSQEPARRRRVDQRADKPTRMRETENDRAIVQLVFAYRVLSQSQLERLLGLAQSTVQRLLRRLYDHRYLDRVFLPITRFGSSPALYILDKEGIALLRRMGVEDFTAIPGKDLSSLFLEHTLAINEVRIAIAQACEAHGWTLAQWLTENELKADYDRVYVKGERRSVALVPDSFFSIYVPEKGTTHCFLELDRGTMTLKRFRDKVAAYVSYYKNGGFKQRFGAQGFRVLTVVDGVGRGRTDSLVQMTAAMAGIGRRFWFAHLDDIQAKSVLSQPIWRVAGGEEHVPLVVS